jgi:hypothetical protein
LGGYSIIDIFWLLFIRNKNLLGEMTQNNDN